MQDQQINQQIDPQIDQHNPERRINQRSRASGCALKDAPLDAPLDAHLDTHGSSLIEAGGGESGTLSGGAPSGVSPGASNEDMDRRNADPQKEFLIAPSLLSADFSRLAEEIDRVARAGADWIHVDVMDGHFVPNLTIGPPVVKSLRPITRLPLDCHLMIENPEKYVEDFARAGADYITIHVEATRDPAACLRRIRELGVRAGITLRPSTPVAEIFPYLTLVDLVLVMTVQPGFSGQGFMVDQVAKIGAIRKELRRVGHQALIEIDGGVNPITAKELTEADVLVAGNAVFKANDYAAAIGDLKAAKNKSK